MVEESTPKIWKELSTVLWALNLMKPLLLSLRPLFLMNCLEAVSLKRRSVIWEERISQATVSFISKEPSS